jgi:ABC-type Fe3+ transport system substrate-binding protein
VNNFELAHNWWALAKQLTKLNAHAKHYQKKKVIDLGQFSGGLVWLYGLSLPSPAPRKC